MLLSLFMLCVLVDALESRQPLKSGSGNTTECGTRIASPSLLLPSVISTGAAYVSASLQRVERSSGRSTFLALVARHCPNDEWMQAVMTQQHDLGYPLQLLKQQARADGLCHAWLMTQSCPR